MRLDFKDLAGLVTEAGRAVAAAGDIVRSHWDQPSTVTRKGRIDLVTQTDLAVEEALKESLSGLLPGSTFLAEESAETLDPGELTWIIDPLDGTTNFAHRLPFVATSVALWSGGQSVLGFVNAPVMGEMFHAVIGGGAYCNGRPIVVSRVEGLEDSLVATGFPYTVREDIRQLMADLENMLINSQGVRRPGAASIDLAYTAAGRFDAFYEIGLKPWDTAAGWLLVTEAGGRVSQYDPNQPYNLNSRGILASNGLVHEAVAGLLGTM
jgi:myo-inositol-1(or 4)-monophosphatase